MKEELTLLDKIMLFTSGLFHLAYTALHIAFLLLFAYFVGLMAYEAIIGG